MICFVGVKNGVDMSVGEPADINPSGFENCSILHSHIRFESTSLCNSITHRFASLIRTESITKADKGQAVAVSVCDCRIFYDGSVIQEKRFA